MLPSHTDVGQRPFRSSNYWGPTPQSHHEGTVHKLCDLTLQSRLYLAPIENPKTVLDIGFGTGLWACELAKSHPQSQVIGIHPNPADPSPALPNLSLQTSDTSITTNDFDLLHIRGLAGRITVDNWRTWYAENLKLVKSGGWLEQLEWSVHLRNPDGTLFSQQWSQYAVSYGARTGRTWEIAENMAGLMQEAGFVDVAEKRFKWPVGSWSSDVRLQEIGKWNLKRWDEGIEDWVLDEYGKCFPESREQIQSWLSSIRSMLRNSDSNVYQEVRVVYSRKP
ncbi:hypothetical protein Q7P37_004470 [Cladosporium fusiforme]